MLFKIGDLVTRKSYNNDMVFRIVDIRDGQAILSGFNIRLVADAYMDDLVIYKEEKEKLIKDDSNFVERLNDFVRLDRDEYFYLPGKILHIDADQDYLDRCMKFYKDMNILSYGLVMKESDIASSLFEHLEDIKPDVLVITGHDAFYDKKNLDYKSMKNYKNSSNFVDAVKVARNYEKDQEKLIIIAGACQSNYEELIKSGANFASSPKRINIHALDPAIIASSVSLSSKSKPINLLEMLDKTKSGKDGMGGIITNGTMYVGYPR